MMEKTQVKPEGKKSSCHHFWKIDSPNGPTSWGTCVLCGEKKEFKNSWENLRDFLNPFKEYSG